MRHDRFFVHRGRTALLAAALIALGACKSSTGPGDDHGKDVDIIRLVIGGQTIEIEEDGQVSGGPVQLVVGVGTTVTATFLDHDGDPVTLHGSEFRLNVEVVGGIPVTFTPGSTSFTGTLTATAPVAGGTLRFSLWHIAEDHADFGPFSVAVTATEGS